MKEFKKFTAILLAVTLCVGLCPSSVFAAETAEDTDVTADSSYLSGTTVVEVEGTNDWGGC